jgi:hypothetical protein
LKTYLLIINPSLPKSLVAGVLLFCMLIIAGCMPTFNWREVRLEEQKITATFPGKPDSITRTIDLAGTKLPMTMHGVRVKELSYIVGWVKLPELDATASASVLAAMQLGMLRNVGAAAIDGSPARFTPVITDTQIQLTDVSGKAISKIAAKKVVVIPVAPAKDGGVAMQMSALFASHEGYAFQIVAVGSAEQFSQSAEAAESIKVFLESVRFVN